jgi:hypothetical protein
MDLPNQPNMNEVPDVVKQRIMALQNRLTNKESDKVSTGVVIGEENVNVQGQVSAWKKINAASASVDRQPLVSPEPASAQGAPTPTPVPMPVPMPTPKRSGAGQPAGVLDGEVFASPTAAETPVCSSQTPATAELAVSGGKRASDTVESSSSKTMRLDGTDAFSKDGYSMNDNGNSMSQLTSSTSRPGTGTSRTKPITNWFTNTSGGTGAGASMRSPPRTSEKDGVTAGGGAAVAVSGTNTNGGGGGKNSVARSRRKSDASSLVHHGKECQSVGVNTINAAKEEEKFAVTVINHLKKELEVTRQGKELAEARAARIELELKTHGDNCMMLQERNRRWVFLPLGISALARRVVSCRVVLRTAQHSTASCGVVPWRVIFTVTIDMSVCCVFID